MIFELHKSLDDIILGNDTMNMWLEHQLSLIEH